MSEIEYDDDEITAEELSRLRQWAHAKCERWNWNADVAEIAKELIDEGVDPDGHQFQILCEVFNKFFSNPKIDVTEAIEKTMETFS